MALHVIARPSATEPIQLKRRHNINNASNFSKDEIKDLLQTISVSQGRFNRAKRFSLWF
jgi:hypothetical protein